MWKQGKNIIKQNENSYTPPGLRVPTSFKKISYLVLGLLVIFGLLAYYWKTRT